MYSAIFVSVNIFLDIIVKLFFALEKVKFAVLAYLYMDESNRNAPSAHAEGPKPSENLVLASAPPLSFPHANHRFGALRLWP